MTTIILNENIVATDSYINDGSIITTLNREKRVMYKGAVFFVTGNVTAEENLAYAFFGEEYDKSKNDVGAFVRFDGDTYECAFNHEGEFWKEKIRDSEYRAIGSGGYMALAAMDAGASVLQAMEIVSKRDIWTGGEIKVYNLTDFDNVSE